MLRRYSLVYVSLLALLGLTVATAFLPLGAGNLLLNLGISALKAALVAAFFMHLARTRGLPLLVAGIIILWLMILFGLGMADYLTR